MNIKSSRFLSFLAFFTTVLMLSYAYYEQYVNGLNPCPLCLVQRFIILIIGVLFLITFIFNPQKRMKTISGIVITLISLTGAFVSAWHVRMQHLPPDEIPDCGPGLEYMVQNFPIGTIFKNLFTGSGQCAEIDWQFLGLSMPAWTFVCFVGFLIYTIIWMRIKND
ncbi:MAG: disulfide bond formation protein B [Gammaproteobacteria bacterium]